MASSKPRAKPASAPRVECRADELTDAIATAREAIEEAAEAALRLRRFPLVAAKVTRHSRDITIALRTARRELKRTQAMLRG